MALYVMSDIHGCFDSFNRMLGKINFSDKDTLVLAGDYIDRGYQNLEMLNWLKAAPNNVICILGNHDRAFIGDIKSMQYVAELNKLTDIKEIYKLASKDIWGSFDHYGTIRYLIYNNHVSFEELVSYKNMMDNYGYLYETTVNERHVIIVHAGYVTPEKFRPDIMYNDIEDYYVWARDRVYSDENGVQDTIIVAGHSPTISKSNETFNDGDVFRYYNEKLNCTMYDIDCGCAFHNPVYYPNAKLACIRLDDEKIFYTR